MFDKKTMNPRRIHLLLCLFVCSVLLIGAAVVWAGAKSPKAKQPGPGQGARDAQTSGAHAEESALLKTQEDEVNYAIGVNMMGNFKQQGIDINLDLVIKGMRDAASGGKLLLSEGELQKSIILYHEKLRRIQSKARTAAAAENRKEGQSFLAENKTKEGVVTLPSGLQYRILKVGDGKIPSDADTVECHYRGTLINGSEFGNSYHLERPPTFRVEGVIPGLKEALKLMPVGSKWQLFIPPELGYGERGSNAPIGPNATLIYEVELLNIK